MDLAAAFCAPPPIVTCANWVFQLPASCIRRCRGRCLCWICVYIRKAWSSMAIWLRRGLNIGAENLIWPRPKAPVRDLHFRVEGAVVRQIEQISKTTGHLQRPKCRSRPMRCVKQRRAMERSTNDCRRAGPRSRSVGSRPFVRN